MNDYVSTPKTIVYQWKALTVRTLVVVGARPDPCNACCAADMANLDAFGAVHQEIIN